VAAPLPWVLQEEQHFSAFDSLGEGSMAEEGSAAPTDSNVAAAAVTAAAAAAVKVEWAGAALTTQHAPEEQQQQQQHGHKRRRLLLPGTPATTGAAAASAAVDNPLCISNLSSYPLLGPDAVDHGSSSGHARSMTPASAARAQQQQQQRVWRLENLDTHQPKLRQQRELVGSAQRRTLLQQSGSHIPSDSAALQGGATPAGVTIHGQQQHADAPGMEADRAAAAAVGVRRVSSSATPAPALCIPISSRGLEVSSAAWAAWLPQVEVTAAVLKVALRFQVLQQQQQQQQQPPVLLPAGGPVVARAARGADGTIRWGRSQLEPAVNVDCQRFNGHER
jgi:hypothetical protein